MKQRQIILETRVGSHLYGTNRPESDEDFQGIFMPSKEDLCIEILSDSLEGK